MAKIEREQLAEKGYHRVIFVMAYEIREGDIILPYENGKETGDRYSVEEAHWGEDGDGDVYVVWTKENVEGESKGEFCDPGKQYRLDLTETYSTQRR